MGEVFRRNPDVIVAEVDGARRLLNLANWTYASLNETAESIWQLLEQPAGRAELLVRLGEEFDAPEDVLATDLDAFLRRLREQELISLA